MQVRTAASIVHQPKKIARGKGRRVRCESAHLSRRRRAAADELWWWGGLDTKGKWKEKAVPSRDAGELEKLGD